MMNPLFSIRPGSVAIRPAEDKRAILGALGDLFAHAYALDADAVVEQLAGREKLGSTGFGRKVAIPHARMSGLQRPACALLRLRRPVDFAAADGLPVELVFGLISPANSGATHLHALAAVSRLVRDDKVRDALVDAPHEEALYALLIDAAGRDAERAAERDAA